MAPAIRFAEMESSTSHKEVLRPASASLVSQMSDNRVMFSSNSRKRKRRSFLTGDIAIERARTFPSTGGLSSSLDEESRMEDVFHEPERPSPLSTNMLLTSVGYKHRSPRHQQERSSISTPKFKLKPRPKTRRSAASSGRNTELYFNSRLSSFKTPPPKIFIPFLPPPRKQSCSEQEESKPSPARAQPQKPLPPPPPLMPQFEASIAFATPTKAKISYESKEPELLLRPRKARRTMGLSRPLSSPPPLIPSFDYGVSSTTRDAITPPPGANAAKASFMTPHSIMVTKTPLSMASAGNPDKNLVVAKPIARRPLITPSTHHGSGTKDPKNIKPSIFECSPRRVFPSSVRNTNNSIERNGVASSSLLSSMENSAFSFSSSIPPSLFSSTIGRTLSTDKDD